MNGRAAEFLSLYGRRDVFKRQQRRGFTHLAFGMGDVVKEERVILWAFYRQDGRVATYEFRKMEPEDGPVYHVMPYGAEYDRAEFELLVEKRGVRLGETWEIARVLETWRLAGDICRTV